MIITAIKETKIGIEKIKKICEEKGNQLVVGKINKLPK